MSQRSGSRTNRSDPPPAGGRRGPAQAGPALPIPLHPKTTSAVDATRFAIGGRSDFFATPRDAVFELDPDVGSSAPKTAMPTARGSPAAALRDGGICVAGGVSF